SNANYTRLKAFHAYKIYCRMIASSQNINLQSNLLSIVASRFWSQERSHVKEIYQFLATEAEALFRDTIAI
ncbi:5341_t:CDS:2, partial [Scutellospora calospora]